MSEIAPDTALDMTDEEWDALSPVIEIPETVERALKFMRSYCYESRDYMALGREVEMFGPMVERDGTPSDVAVLDEIRRRLAEGEAYERLHGPYSLLNWENPTVVWVERALAARGKPTRRQTLDAWRAAHCVD